MWGGGLCYNGDNDRNGDMSMALFITGYLEIIWIYTMPLAMF